MKLTKFFLCNLVLIFSINTFAQVRVKNIIGVSPTLTHNYNPANNHFPIVLDKNYLFDNIDYKYLDKKMNSPSFSSYVIPITISKEQANNFFINTTFGFGQDKFTSELLYTARSTLDLKSTDHKIKEEVDAYRLFGQLNIGKAIYFAPEKKLMIMPYMGGFFSFYEFGRTLSSDDKYTLWMPNTTSGYTTLVGMNFGVAVNYQFGKHFGLGLNFIDIIRFYNIEVTNENYPKDTIRKNQLDINFRNTPTISLLYYFNSKPGLFY